MRDDKGRFAEGNEGRPKGSVGKSNKKYGIHSNYY